MPVETLAVPVEFVTVAWSGGPAGSATGSCRRSPRCPWWIDRSKHRCRWRVALPCLGLPDLNGEGKGGG